MNSTISEVAANYLNLREELNFWRFAMPGDLLRACPKHPDNGLAAYLGSAKLIDPKCVTHAQLLPHIHYTLAGHIEDDPMEPTLRAVRLRNGLLNRHLRIERDMIHSDLENAGIEALFFKAGESRFQSILTRVAEWLAIWTSLFPNAPMQILRPN